MSCNVPMNAVVLGDSKRLTTRTPNAPQEKIQSAEGLLHRSRLAGRVASPAAQGGDGGPRAGPARHVQLDHGVKELAELLVVLVGASKQPDVELLKARSRGAAQLGREQPSAFVVGPKAVSMLAAGLHACHQCVPRRLVERVALQRQP